MLVEEGYPKEYMDRICTPIGLDIGAVTPGEIAISILAELVAYKRLPKHSNDGIRCCNDSDVELSVIKYLAENREPKAIVTVIETKGSTRENGGKPSCGSHRQHRRRMQRGRGYPRRRANYRHGAL